MIPGTKEIRARVLPLQLHLWFLDPKPHAVKLLLAMLFNPLEDDDLRRIEPNALELPHVLNTCVKQRRVVETNRVLMSPFSIRCAFVLSRSLCLHRAGFLSTRVERFY